MKPILMVYASSTGNTELITDELSDHFKQLGHTVEIKAFYFDAIDIDQLSQYSAIVVGTYTWDDGDLPYEVEDFYIDLEIAPIKGLPFAVYGAADSCYDTFGAAIDLVAERAEEFGADVSENRLKIDLLPSKDDEIRLQQFAQEVSEKVKTNERVMS